MRMTLAQAAAWISEGHLQGDPATPIARVHTDTRTLRAGDLFVALKGERFDANEFLADAQAHGAAAAIAQRALPPGMNGLVVPDALVALGRLAAGWRAQYRLPLIAVTGSNGKTTVTQMIAAVLRAAAPEATLATEGNLNNEIGVPLTLLRLGPQHQRGVVELGMNHPGEIARLAAMARPTIALVNNAQREHQEFMHTVEAVARENAAVFAALPADGTAVYPHGDPFTALWGELAREGAATRRSLHFGAGAGADVGLTRAHWDESAQGPWQLEVRTPLGPMAATLAVAGQHNLMNALAATACALAAGVSLGHIAQGLAAFRPVAGRSRSLSLRWPDGRPLMLVDDSYNANPDSVRAAIDVLAGLPGPRLLVLGDMGEVGDQAGHFHAEVGAYARERGIERLFALGDHSVHGVAAFADEARATHFQRLEELLEALATALPAVRSVLVKGSRFMRMERVVQAAAARVQPPENQQEEAGHAH